jgi:hypothetical protein
MKPAAFRTLLAALFVGIGMALGGLSPRAPRVRNAWPDLAGNFAL